MHSNVTNIIIFAIIFINNNSYYAMKRLLLPPSSSLRTSYSRKRASSMHLASFFLRSKLTIFSASLSSNFSVTNASPAQCFEQKLEPWIERLRKTAQKISSVKVMLSIRIELETVHFSINHKYKY